MRSRVLLSLLVPVLLCGCAVGVNVESMLQDFDDYEKDAQALSPEGEAAEALEAGQAKRAEAGSLVEQGKKKDAAPLAEQAIADARLALEMDRMTAANREAEKCRRAVQSARTQWLEAVFVLTQTEEFAGQQSPVSKDEPSSPAEAPSLPSTTLDAAPATVGDEPWSEWRRAATQYEVPAADLDVEYRRIMSALASPKTKEADTAHLRYLAGRTAQALECRVRASANERVCIDANYLVGAFGDARADALGGTLDLERGLQENLRTELHQLRADAQNRQDELYGALQQMEGKFASIRRDARGTIVSLADILFDFDKATLKRDVEFNLVKIATILNQFGEMNILIEGHTDSIGTEEYNLGLSQRRAKAVYEFLISQDVREERMTYEGYGETRPVADNDTDEGRQKNRRVDLVIQDAQ